MENHLQTNQHEEQLKPIYVLDYSDTAVFSLNLMNMINFVTVEVRVY